MRSLLASIGCVVWLGLAGGTARADVPPSDAGEPREGDGGCQVGGGGAGAAPLAVGAWLLVGRRRRRA